MCPLRSLETHAARSRFIVYLSFYRLNILLLLCVCLSVFGNIIAIDAEFLTDFKFNSTRAYCFNSHNDVPQLAQRNVSIFAHTRHRSLYLPQPDCCCSVPFLITSLSSIQSLSQITATSAGDLSYFSQDNRWILSSSAKPVCQTLCAVFIQNRMIFSLQLTLNLRQISNSTQPEVVVSILITMCPRWLSGTYP